jgi:protein-tyrosine phosphatase
VAGYIDLHSHWVAGIDDGARTADDGHAMLVALKRAGFERVVATPHMRPGMFDNVRSSIERAFAETSRAIGAGVEASQELPSVELASEHFFDDVVFGRLMEGDGVVYPGGHAVLVELPVRSFPARLADRFSDLSRRGLTPVLAHPERYEPVWKDATVLEPLIDAGAVLLLDVAALVGKYDLKGCTFFVVAVPTPDRRRTTVPDLTPVVKASETVGKVLGKGDVVVYESTVYPGVTEEILRADPRSVSGLKRARLQARLLARAHQPGRQACTRSSAS